LGVTGLYFLWLVVLYVSDRAAYWRQIWYFAVFLVVVLAGTFTWKKLRYRLAQKKLDGLLDSLKQKGLEEDVQNFINRWMQKEHKNGWTYRGHGIDWARLEDFRKLLNDKGMNLSLDKWDDTSTILRYYIQQKEEGLTRESISLTPKKFNDLSGAEFEDLLYRLSVAMGYAVQKSGKTGDQGGDLIANRDGQRIVIQAKCYAGTVGNAAVQEAIAAQKYYDCNRAMVITNSNFTKEAVDLAKISNVRLIGGGELSELLLRHLKESWG